MAKVTVIKPTINPHTHISIDAPHKRRVAAYARVSTDQDEQFTSYEAQIDYYTKYIKANDEWEFVNVYTDEGISGTSTKRRDGFKQMIEDALNGKIDLIVTKSISRFARNTVDALVNIRKLKEKGVEVFFEKDNIYTLGTGGELLLTIMSSIAQEESRSISENVTWGKRKAFQDGKVALPYKCFLGYKKGENGLPEIEPDGACLVRRIYRMFIEGKSQSTIARILTEENIPTPGGKTKWQYNVIDSILRNEKYKGSALLQKKYTVDFLTKKLKKNNGEVAQYYVEDSHPAIISPDEWELVQTELELRDGLETRNRRDNVLSGRVICADCGSIYGPKVWHSNDAYRRIVWQCNNKFNGTKCTTPTLDEETIKNAYLKALNILLKDRDALISNLLLVKEKLLDVNLSKPIEQAKNEMLVVSGLCDQHIFNREKKLKNSQEYMDEYIDLVKRFTAVQDEYGRLIDEQVMRNRKSIKLQAFIDEIKNADTLNLEFNDKLFNLTIINIKVYKDSHLEFNFKDGSTINIEL